MSSDPKHRYSLEEYLEKDLNSEARLEYWNGEIFDMSGVSPEHAQIEVNLTVQLGSGLVGRGCRIFPANVGIKVPSFPPYRYADLSALCGDALYETLGGVKLLVNPGLIVEVLSDSTEGYDRGDKFSYYKSILSFREYLLIAQHRPHVSQFIREQNDSWRNLEYNHLEDSIRIASMDYVLPLARIYDGVAFNQTPPSSRLRPADPRLLDRN